MKLMRLTALSGFVAAALAVLPCQASTIQLGISGDAEVGSNYIDFGQYPTGAPYAPAPSYGTFEVTTPITGLFLSAGVASGEFGSIQSLNEGTGSVTLPGPFMTFDTGGSNLQVWVTNIPAANVGPFDLTDTADGAVAAFNVEGYIWDTNTMSQVETFSGTFSATFDGESVSNLQNDLPLDTPFSATFTATATPEPASALLLGIGLVGAGVIARKKASKS